MTEERKAEIYRFLFEYGWIHSEAENYVREMMLDLWNAMESAYDEGASDLLYEHFGGTLPG